MIYEERRIFLHFFLKKPTSYSRVYYSFLIIYCYDGLICEDWLSFFCPILYGVPLHILLYVFISYLNIIIKWLFLGEKMTIFCD